MIMNDKNDNYLPCYVFPSRILLNFTKSSKNPRSPPKRWCYDHCPMVPMITDQASDFLQVTALAQAAGLQAQSREFAHPVT